MAELEPPRVFISYSHDSPAHQDRVLDFADRLRADGIDASIDQYVPFPGEGWPNWCEAEIRKAQFVLLVCGASGSGAGFRRPARADGIDASIDQYVPFPGEGWPGWCETEIRKAQFVLLVCTAMNAAPCFLRACFMSCSRAIGASWGQGPTLPNCLVFGVHLRSATGRVEDDYTDDTNRSGGDGGSTAFVASCKPVCGKAYDRCI